MTTYSRQVELPNGDRRSFAIESIADLRRQVFALYGDYAERDVDIIDVTGNVVSGTQVPPRALRVVPHPGWGAIDERQLCVDLRAAAKAFAYTKGFKLKLLHKDALTPFLVYLLAYGRQWLARVELSDYPLTRFPAVTFVKDIPPCPLHGIHWHPNVRSDGTVCFGRTEHTDSIHRVRIFALTLCGKEGRSFLRIWLIGRLRNETKRGA